MGKTASKQLEHMRNMRNIGIIAHIDAGKTTLTERMLFYTRKIHRMGEVHDGTATMDFMPEEQERGITIAAAATSCCWGNYALNIIDTPGHVDFTIEVERSLRVLDGAVGVFCAVGGVEPQSETVWKQSEHFGVPKLAFINKIDRIGADFSAVVNALQERLGANPLAVNIPAGEGDAFQGIIDLISLRFLEFSQADQGVSMEIRELTKEESSLAFPWRERLLEGLADVDDTFMERYLDGEFTEEDIHAALRRATLAHRACPLLAGSALRNTGVQPLLDAIGRYLPSPLDVPAPLGTKHGEDVIVDPDPAGDPVALVFKVQLEEKRKLALLRIYSGTLREGDSVCNASRKTDERISRIFRLHADRREQLSEALTGDIVAVLGLRSARTGDTITAPRSSLLLERVDGRQPVISLALEPRNSEEGKILDEALERYQAEDPTLTAALDEGSGHRIVSGMGELHLEVLLERMQREYGLSPRSGQPQVVMRETLARAAEGEGRFDRELGNVHHLGAVILKLSPRERGTGNRVLFTPEYDPDIPRTKGGMGFPRQLAEEVRQGVLDNLLSGPVTGYPVQDVEVLVTHIGKEEGRTTPAGCHMAAGMAMRDALEKGKSLTLEPIMRVEISVPDDFLGNAISLFNTRGGRVEHLSERAGFKTIEGIAPMRKLFGFTTDLRSATQGRAGLVMRFETYDSL